MYQLLTCNFASNPDSTRAVHIRHEMYVDLCGAYTTRQRHLVGACLSHVDVICRYWFLLWKKRWGSCLGHTVSHELTYVPSLITGDPFILPSPLVRLNDQPVLCKRGFIEIHSIRLHEWESLFAKFFAATLHSNILTL